MVDITNNMLSNKSDSDDISVNSKATTQYINKILGENIKLARIHNGMSQNQLASLLGITFQQVQKYEKGLNRIVVNRLFVLAHALSTSVDELLRGISYNGISTSSYNVNDYSNISSVREYESSFVYDDNKCVSKEVLMLVRVYKGIKNEKVRSSIYNLVKALSLEEHKIDCEE